ncbi:MAG TPA: M23 family metallopeptidase [Kofleriaceae bacterium]|nr:M23 family metallopeptidase [Kofleriaceae bacterium]
MVAPTCPRCASEVSLHEGRPAVTATGNVELWHLGCWENRDVPIAAAATESPEDPGRGRRRWSIRFGNRRPGARAWLAGGLAVVLVGGGLAVMFARGAEADAPQLASTFASASREPLAIRGSMPTREDAPPRAPRIFKPIEASDEIPVIDGKPLDELYPSLHGWVHPVTASAEYMPTEPPRLFGAERAGVERAECGAGHCGVDLDGPRGRPIVAVAAGTIVRVERSERGADGRSGRYVRIQHEDGTFTAYMHMDEVGEGLEVGVAVARGQYVGTLGATATYASPPHLHFSLEIPNDGARDVRGDHVATHYVNPAPFLMRATIAPVIERPNRPALN